MMVMKLMIAVHVVVWLCLFMKKLNSQLLLDRSTNVPVPVVTSGGAGKPAKMMKRGDVPTTLDRSTVKFVIGKNKPAVNGGAVKRVTVAPTSHKKFKPTSILRSGTTSEC